MHFLRRDMEDAWAERGLAQAWHRPAFPLQASWVGRWKYGDHAQPNKYEHAQAPRFIHLAERLLHSTAICSKYLTVHPFAVRP